MSKVTDKVKEKLKGAKDKVASITKEGASTTKEKMTSAKDKAKDKVASITKEGAGSSISSSTSSSSEQRKKVVVVKPGEPDVKTGAAETGSEYEQGAAGTNE